MQTAQKKPLASAYPLQWPTGFPRTKWRESPSRWKTNLNEALKFLRSQLNLFGGTDLVLSSNCSLGSENHSDPGVCAYFRYNGKTMAIPCDRWDKVAHNVKAIAMTIEAIRGMERWGAKAMIEAMFTGFVALPEMNSESVWQVLGLERHDPAIITEQDVLDAYHELAKAKHPDKPGGSTADFVELCKAKDLALSTIRNR